MATDRDRFGHRLGKSWKKVRERIAYSRDQAGEFIAEYLDGQLLRISSRDGLQQLLQSLARADQVRDSRLLRTEDPEYVSSVAVIKRSEPYVCQLALEALRILEAPNSSRVSSVDMLASVAVRWLRSQCRVQSPYSSDSLLHDILSVDERKATEELERRLRARLHREALHKKKYRAETSELMHLNVEVLP